MLSLVLCLVCVNTITWRNQGEISALLCCQAWRFIVCSCRKLTGASLCQSSLQPNLGAHRTGPLFSSLHTLVMDGDRLKVHFQLLVGPTALILNPVRLALMQPSMALMNGARRLAPLGCNQPASRTALATGPFLRSPTSSYGWIYKHSCCPCLVIMDVYASELCENI